MSFKLQSTDKLNDWKGKLNEAQNLAVEHINGPLLLIAGAGSGKTRVLTTRIANLIQTGVEPWKILTLTFTNKAAREMKERIGKILTIDQAERIWAGTFHSIFARILRIEADKFGFTSNFTIYDAEDQLAAIKTIMNRLSIPHQNYPPKAIRSVISDAKNRMVNSTEFSQNAEGVFDRKVAEIYNNYTQYLRDNNSMDFDDLLLYMYKLLTLSQDIKSFYQEKFKYILVDEYQDTNKVQYLILRELAKAHQNICVVGDDAQSIYKWRGADVKNILDFQKDYPQCKVIKLEQNYRSTKTILAAADEVIRHNKTRLEKNLWTDNQEGELIDVFECEDDRAEAQKIADTVLKLKSGIHNYDSFAVLYRTNAQSLALENTFRRSNIPYVVIGGLSFFKRKEVKDVLAYLKLLINQNDNESLFRIVNEPPRGLGKTSLEHIDRFAQARGISLYESFASAELNMNLQKRAVVNSKKFISVIETHKQKILDHPSFENIQAYLEDTGLIDMYKEIPTEDSQDRLNNIEQLLNDIEVFLKEGEGFTIQSYLEQSALATDYDDKEIGQERVTLMTLHTAKGLEFPNVIIAGLEQGLFPLMRSDYDKEEEEEERRLFYVGVTRAMDKLVLTHSKRRMKFGEMSSQMMSSFIREIPAKYLNQSKRSPKPQFAGTGNIPSGLFANKNNKNLPLKDRFSAPPTNEYSQVSDFDNYSQVGAETDFSVGDIVSHSQFGNGKISSLKGEGPRRQAVVRFDSIGRKMLMLKYAKLKLIKKLNQI